MDNEKVYLDLETGGLDGKPKIAIVGTGGIAASISHALTSTGLTIEDVNELDYQFGMKHKQYYLTNDDIDIFPTLEDNYLPVERSLYGFPKNRNKPDKRNLTKKEFNARKKKKQKQSKDRHRK